MSVVEAVPPEPHHHFDLPRAGFREIILIERMTSNRVQRGLGMKELRDLTDLTIYDIKPIGIR